jgi:hypothetical protein
LKVDHDEVHTLGGWCNFTIEKSTQQVAEVNQELFDKLLEKGSISVDGWRIEDAGSICNTKQTKIIRRCYWVLIESTKFDYPTNFLKWLQTGEKNYLLKEKLVYVLKRFAFSIDWR